MRLFLINEHPGRFSGMEPALLLIMAALVATVISLMRSLRQARTVAARAEESLTALRGETANHQLELEMGAQSLAQTNALLAQASNRFQELFQGLPVACFCYDRAGRIMEWNRAFERLYRLENILGASIWNSVYPREEAPQIADAIAAVLEGVAQEGIAWSHHLPDGSLRHLFCSIFPIRGVDGAVTGAISADVDITAQHEAEEALRASEERLHALYNTTSQQSLSFEEKTQSLLNTGCTQFSLEIGVLARIIGDQQEVIQAIAPDSVIEPGTIFPASDGYGRATLNLVRASAEAEISAEVSIGAPIRVNSEVWGTLCFAGHQPQARLFTSGDREMVRLMAQWLGGEVARRQAEEAVRESEERFRSAIASMSEALIVMDAEGIIRLCNDSAEQILKLTRSEIKEWRPLNPDYVAHREDGTPFPQGSYPLFVSLRTGQPQRNVVMGLPRPGGSLLWVSVNSNPLFVPGEDVPYAVVATFSDITERRRCEDQINAQMAQIREYTDRLEVQKAQLEAANAQLEALALHDELTGLGNRRALGHRLTHEMERAERYRYALSLLMLDVDQFKEYNDEFGHQAGDEVLRMLSRILEGQGRETDFYARYGGEEFVIILPHTDSDGALVVAERLRVSLEKLSWPGRPVSASFGAATLLPAMKDEAGLLAAADAAMYAAKIAGRNRCVHAQSLPSLAYS